MTPLFGLCFQLCRWLFLPLGQILRWEIPHSIQFSWQLRGTLQIRTAFYWLHVEGKVPASKEQIFLDIRPCKILVVSKTYILPVYGNSADHINSLQSPQSLLNMGDAEKGDDFPQGQTVSWNQSSVPIPLVTLRDQTGPLVWSCKGTPSYSQCKARCQSWILGTPGRPLSFPRRLKRKN